MNCAVIILSGNGKRAFILLFNFSASNSSNNILYEAGAGED